MVRLNPLVWGAAGNLSAPSTLTFSLAPRLPKAQCARNRANLEKLNSLPEKVDSMMRSAHAHYQVVLESVGSTLSRDKVAYAQ